MPEEWKRDRDRENDVYYLIALKRFLLLLSTISIMFNRIDMRVCIDSSKSYRHATKFNFYISSTFDIWYLIYFSHDKWLCYKIVISISETVHIYNLNTILQNENEKIQLWVHMGDNNDNNDYCVDIKN